MILYFWGEDDQRAEMLADLSVAMVTLYYLPMILYFLGEDN
jgi:hypothetical protein